MIRKISTVFNLKEPTNVKEFRSFIGLVNYYRDFIPQRSHILAPLTSLTSPKLPFMWSTTCCTVFKKLKIALATSTLLPYPNPRLPFIIEPVKLCRRERGMLTDDATQLVIACVGFDDEG